MAGIGLAFARALGDFGATLMIGGSIPGQTRTLSLMIYDAYNAGDERLAGLLVLVLSGLCLVFALFASTFARKS
jgi:molybdate transport system permease protein